MDTKTLVLIFDHLRDLEQHLQEQDLVQAERMRGKIELLIDQKLAGNIRDALQWNHEQRRWFIR